MGHVNIDRPVARIFAAVLGATLVGATLLSPAGVNVALAQTEPLTAANGVVLPSPYDDPAAARIAALAESDVVTDASTASALPADESAANEAPDAVAETSDAGTGTTDSATGAPESGSAAPIVLGGADVAVSSVGGSNEVDRPSKRSDRKR